MVSFLHRLAWWRPSYPTTVTIDRDISVGLPTGIAALRLELDRAPRAAIRPVVEVVGDDLFVWYERPIWHQGRMHIGSPGGFRYGPIKVTWPPEEWAEAAAWAAEVADELRNHAEPEIVLYQEGFGW